MYLILNGEFKKATKDSLYQDCSHNLGNRWIKTIWRTAFWIECHTVLGTLHKALFWVQIPLTIFCPLRHNAGSSLLFKKSPMSLYGAKLPIYLTSRTILSLSPSVSSPLWQFHFCKFWKWRPAFLISGGLSTQTLGHWRLGIPHFHSLRAHVSGRRVGRGRGRILSRFLIQRGTPHRARFHSPVIRALDVIHNW